MKTKSLILVALMLLISVGVMAQNYTFRVLTAKGENKANGQAVRVGAKLQATDKIVMEEGGYLGLLHANGQTVELRNKGTYTVSELANNLSAKATSDLTARYAQYVVSELTSSADEASGDNRVKHMTKTGAVTRATTIGPVTFIQSNKVELLGDKLEINWFVVEELASVKKSDVKKYRVSVLDLRNNVLFTETTDKNYYVIDFTRPELKNQKNVIYKVEVADGDKKVSSAHHNVNKAKKSKQLQETLSQIGDDTALGHLIKAQYLEEEEFYAEAAMAYKQAMQLAPDVETYRILYDSFIERTEMSEQAILAKAKQKNSQGE